MATSVKNTVSIARLGVALLLLQPSVQAQEKSKLLWGWADFAPYSIPRGVDQNRGSLDDVRALLINRLTGYDHETISAPIPRIIFEIQQGKHWCWIAPYQTAARQRFAVFSLPVAVELPHKLVISRNRLNEFKAMGSLSLKDILSNEKLKGAFTRQRSYGPTIDAVMLRHPPPNSEYHASFNQPLLMILADRVDYTIEYPLVVDYISRESGLSDKLVSLPFKEGTDLKFRRVMCPKNEWGVKLIDNINAILRSERPTTRYRAMVEKWQGPEGARQIRQVYDHVFLKTE